MRKDRIASVMIRAVSDIIEHEIKDPRLGLVTVTTVDVSSDLKKATVYFSSLKDKDVALTTLNRAKGYIRTELANRVRIKYIPDIEFKIDNSYEYGKKIDALIDEISQDNKEQ
ncbi:MAG: 30S ribosome-binding factor RbfA [candidate division WOR-3 bacterium]|nr:MAG: 30S ribosome-binding factor RbfA [candidate division WOR-3 bacterium]